MARRTAVVALVTVGAVIAAFAAVAFGFTSADWEPRAIKWQNAACTQATLSSKESLATNQKIALCFALARAQEDKASIATLQSQVARLEANQAPAPKDVSFFDHYEAPGTEATSTVYDANGYNTIDVLTDLKGVSHASLEVSDDGTTWTLERDILTNATTEPFAVVARYYRVTIKPPEGSHSPYTATVLGHLKP
jgi:hypothetical protein